MSETLGLVPALRIDSRKPGYHLWEDDALSELFPGALNPGPTAYTGRVLGVEEVVQGTLESPYFLDSARRWRSEYAIEEVGYMAIIPEDPDPSKPVVIFGHAVVTDRRFLLTIAGALAQRGFYSVAIDFPFHGDRTVCVDASLVAVPNFFPESIQPIVGYEEELIWLPPCVSGDDASCSPSGECLGPDGEVEPFNTFPIMDLKPASGAAFCCRVALWCAAASAS